MLIDFTASFIIFLSLLLILFLVTAVTRNRIKRRLRNIMNEAVKSINIILDYCYLLIARISVSRDPYETIKNATLEDFKKIKWPILLNF